MYQLILNSDCVLRVADHACIPNDPLNADRAAYDKWLAAGNTPQAADPVEPVVPESITRYKGKMHLLAIGEYDSIKADVDSPASPEALRVGFYDAQDWRRDSPLIAAIAEKRKWSDKYLDQLFMQASQIP
ncbi:hypothetical protein [Chitinibacter tainanensis]|uniref:hypothetical protein n=1 Tax=Chitinibacter tainanensis TaxID=230667 RepID=UPI002352A177|nr:hypothetical protein [Chitinibacter tainanensis]